jgi:hypothetical protein
MCGFAVGAAKYEWSRKTAGYWFFFKKQLKFIGMQSERFLDVFPG